jgi:hypothetical protein
MTRNNTRKDIIYVIVFVNLLIRAIEFEWLMKVAPTDSR